jgi:HAD superfamily hydrolase (TIGR01509 family)
MSPVRGVVFDMDGLMFDTERVFVQAWDAVGERMGVGKAGDMVLKTIGMSTQSAYGLWTARFGEDFDMDALRAHTRAFLRAYYQTHDTPLKPGLFEALDALKARGLALAVASSTKRAEALGHLDGAGVTGYFDALIFGDMVERTKPDPEPYRRACQALGLGPEVCLALEDSPSGIRSAHAAGLRVAMIPDLYPPDADILSRLCARLDSLAEVPALIDRLDAQ